MFFRQNVASIQGDARHLPLPDASVDLIITSPPYYALRDYQDGDRSVEGQIGREGSPQQFLENMWACTAEFKRVLKPRGSMFINLGDKYDNGTTSARTNPGDRVGDGRDRQPWNTGQRATTGRPKSLIGIPWRYAIGCMDMLDLTLRAEIIWDKPNGLPESVRDRVRRAHEQVFHFTRQGDYYSAVDRIREEHAPNGSARKGKTWEERKEAGEPMRYGDTGMGASGAMAGAMAGNEMGKLPSSVWSIPTQPLVVPKHDGGLLGLEEEFDADHFAAFPPALVKKIILGWSPQAVCTVCGHGRFPVSDLERIENSHGTMGARNGVRDPERTGERTFSTRRVIIGNACACTPYTDHPERRGKDWRGTTSGDRGVTGQRMAKEFQRNSPAFEGNGHPARSGGEWRPEARHDAYGRGLVREYHLDSWDAPPTVQGVVLDPFGGTGTTAIVAAILGRRGITCDLSFGYASKLVSWRMNDRSQMKMLLGSKT